MAPSHTFLDSFRWERRAWRRVLYTYTVAAIVCAPARRITQQERKKEEARAPRARTNSRWQSSRSYRGEEEGGLPR